MILNSVTAEDKLVYQLSVDEDNRCHEGNNWLRATIALVPFRVKLSSMSESTQTSQADLCSCVVFFPKTMEKGLDKQAQKSIPIPPLSLCPQMMLKES